MRKITETRTGCIISDTELSLEYLFVGDYGKENNIKASFLGYDKRIETVKHKPVDLTEKLVVIVFVPSKEEDADRITCGNSLIAVSRSAL